MKKEQDASQFGSRQRGMRRRLRMSRTPGTSSEMIFGETFRVTVDHGYFEPRVVRVLQLPESEVSMSGESRRGDKDGHDSEVTPRRGVSSKDGEVDDSEPVAPTENGSGADLDEGDLEFFEENESED
jgi:hypothetical protein